MTKTKKKRSLKELLAIAKAKMYLLRSDPDVRREGAEAYLSLKKAVKEFKELFEAIKNAKY